jgi:hypothetical protein
VEAAAGVGARTTLLLPRSRVVAGRGAAEEPGGGGTRDCRPSELQGVRAQKRP